MTITIHIQDVDTEDGEIDDFSFDEKETVHDALLRYLTSKDFPDILLIGHCFFKLGDKEISLKENLNNKLADYVKNDQLLEFGLKRNDESGHIYSEEAIDFANVRNCPTKRPFTKTAPYYRHVRRGLNIYGICLNPHCELLNKHVIVKMGKCKINLADIYNIKIPCPNPKCEVNVKPITCGFFMCKYKIKGQMYENGKLEQIDEISETADDENHSNYYNPDFHGGCGMARYIELLIEVTEIIDKK